jgi:hypothetical protein
MKTKKTITDSIGSLFLFGLILSTLGVSCSKDNNSIKPTDFSTLYAEITAAQKVLSTTTEGILPGQYSADAVATLEGAITTAYAVINQGGTAITPSQEAAATVTLTAAVTTYQSSVVAIDPPGTVYVAGWGVGTALWRNGVAISLPGTGFSYANSVYVTSSGVYVAGGDSGGVKLWVNGVPTSLTTFATANSVFVSGSDVYVAGGGIDRPISLAGVWLNGEPTTFTRQGSANSVYVTGSGVYIAGDVDGENLATLWKNGVATFLRDSINYTTANSVFVLGSDVYVAGTMGNVATVWKNGVATSLTDAASPPSSAHSIFVSGSDVYVAGEETSTGPDPVWNITSIAKVWKNGVATSLTDGTYNAWASSVFVSGSDVYVAGTDGRVAILWKNGVATALSSVYGTTANSVFVTN